MHVAINAGNIYPPNKY